METESKQRADRATLVALPAGIAHSHVNFSDHGVTLQGFNRHLATWLHRSAGWQETRPADFSGGAADSSVCQRRRADGQEDAEPEARLHSAALSVAAFLIEALANAQKPYLPSKVQLPVTANASERIYSVTPCNSGACRERAALNVRAEHSLFLRPTPYRPTLRRGPLMFDMLWNSSDYARGAGSPGHMIVVVGFARRRRSVWQRNHRAHSGPMAAERRTCLLQRLFSNGYRNCRR
jgi:hypothetical protein